MYIIKRNGNKEPLDLSKIRKQIDFAFKGFDLNKVEYEASLPLYLKDGIKTTDIQETLILTTKSKVSAEEPDWNYVSGRIAMWDLYGTIFKNTGIKFSKWRNLVKYLVNNGYYKKEVLEKLNKFNITEKDINYGDWKNIDLNNPDFNKKISQVLILKDKYLIKNKDGFIEYPFIMHIANAVLLAENRKEFFDYYNKLANNLISLATPFLANLRKSNGNTGSCFIGSNPDSLTGLIKSWADISSISRAGGGVGWDVTPVRPGNTFSNKIVKSNNIVKWTKILNDIIIAVNQAGTRKGALTIALRWWHLDIYDFMEAKSVLKGDMRQKTFDIFPQVVLDNYIVDKYFEEDDTVYLINHYVLEKETGIKLENLIGEELYKAHELVKELVESGKLKNEENNTVYKKISAREFIKKIFWHWTEVGEFYITHLDNLNLSNYLKYEDDPDRRLFTPCANLCVAPETKILIDEGYRVIKDLEGKEVNVWNGKEWSPVLVVKTGENQKLIKVITTGGELECTLYHKFYVTSEHNNSEIVEKRAWELKPGDKLIKFDLETIEGWISDNEFDLNEPPFMLGSNLYNIKHRVKWFNMFLDSDYISGKSYEYYNKVIMVLETLGIHSYINRISENTYSIMIARESINKAEELGINVDEIMSKLSITDLENHIVYEIVNTDRIDDTYCFTEFKRNMGMFNGILTGQCVESFSVVKTPTKWKEEVDLDKRTTTETDGMYHACNLTSINLVKMLEGAIKGKIEYKDPFDMLDKLEDDIKDTVYTAVDILDRSIDHSTFPVKEAELGAYRLRNVGLGYLGLADVMAYFKLMYDKPDGIKFAMKLTEKIAYHAYRASIELAKKRGSYPWFKPSNYKTLLGRTVTKLNEISKEITGNNYSWKDIQCDIKQYGIRNFLLLAIAPNTSTGIVMGVSPSYLPMHTKDGTQELAKIVVPLIPEFIKERYWYYKTRAQYKVEDIINFTRAIQTFIDTGISMEINLDTNTADMTSIIDTALEGFKLKELKGIYYSRGATTCTDCAN